MNEIVEYETDEGVCPFAEWFDDLDSAAAIKVRAAIARMEAGNLGDTSSVGEGVVERRIDWGPGYRVYFVQDRPGLIVLLCGGTKRRQRKDIRKAKIYRADYRKRKGK